MTTRDIVVDALREDPQINTTHFASYQRWVVVLILDNDTQPYREARSYGDVARARALAADPPADMIGEYLIDLDSATLACAYAIDEDGTVVDEPTMFDENNIAFA